MCERSSSQRPPFRERERRCPLDIIPLAVFSSNEWQLMNTSSALGSPRCPLLSRGFAGGCLGDERKRGRGAKEGGKQEGEKGHSRGAVTPRTSSALRWEPRSSQHGPIKERALRRGRGGGGGGWNRPRRCVVVLSARMCIQA